MTKQTQPHKEEIYIVNVPVKVSFELGETTVEEYEDVIDVEVTEDTPEGKINQVNILYLTREKGFSTDKALFLVASKMHELHAQEFAKTLSVSPPVELKVSVKRNGEITYGKFV